MRRLGPPARPAKLNTRADAVAIGAEPVIGIDVLA